MKLLKDTIEEALHRAGGIEDAAHRELFERELWLHITSVLSLRRHAENEFALGGEPDKMSLLFLNPACSFFPAFKKIFLSLHAAALQTVDQAAYEHAEVS